MNEIDEVAALLKSNNEVTVGAYYALHVEARVKRLERICKVLEYAIYGFTGLLVLFVGVLFKFAEHTH